MKRTVVRYQVKPDQAEANKEAIRAVFAELNRERPEGIRYASYALEDGVTFVHVAAEEEGASLTEREAFKEFQKGLPQRIDTPPEALGADEVGSYG